MVSWRLGHKRFGPGIKSLGFSDTFRFHCQKLGECCEHPVGCHHGTATHTVAGIEWRISTDGYWRCPFLSSDKLCSIFEERPFICRLFPIGIELDREHATFYLWIIDPPQRCAECHSGRKWKVSQWLASNGFWPWLASLDKEESHGS